MGQLPTESFLRARGVDTVIQVLGPNLDPRFPECLANEPDRAQLLLRQCYDRSLLQFWELALAPADATAAEAPAAPPPPPPDTAAASADTPPKSAAAAAAAAAASNAGASSGRGSGEDVGLATPPAGAGNGTKRIWALPEYRMARPIPVKMASGYWNTILYEYLEARVRPRRAEMQKEVYYEDDQCVVIYDGYPKSRYHLLLLPKPRFLNVNEVKDLRRDQHLSRLRQLHATGAAVAEVLSQQGAGVVRCGYHGIPSLRPLHLHIISQDFDEVKKKHQYNGFTTGLFLEASWVEAQLEERGDLELDTTRLRALRATPLRCFKCGRGATNMGTLKDHIRCCTAPLPRHANTGSGT